MDYITDITIQAPPSVVWPILTNAAAYPDWNPTVQRIEGEISPGATITVFATISPDRAFPVSVTELAEPHSMTWTGGMPLGLFKGVRNFTLEPRDGGTVFTLSEVFTGFLLPVMKRAMPDLLPEFEKFAAALKAEAERVAA